MRFLSILTVVAGLQAAQCLIHVKRDAQPILTSLSTISSQIANLTAIVDGFNGGLVGTITALQIQGEASDLLNDVNAAVTTINNTGALNEQDSTTVVNVVVKLQSSIYTVLDALVAKKPAFDTAILGIGSASFLVKADLQGLRTSTANLGSALTSKLVSQLQRLAPLITSDIDFHFARALQVYN